MEALIPLPGARVIDENGNICGTTVSVAYMVWT